MANKGIGNEIGFYTFCYDPSLEFECRAYVDELMADAQAGKLPCNLEIFNLYDVMLDICEQRRILRAIPRREAKVGSEAQIKELQKPCSSKSFAQYLLEHTQPHQPGDVILLTGVGEVFPLLRVHNLLNDMFADFETVPVVVMYPGSFDGYQLKLFNRESASNYYRAFDIS
ncbi:DUF1788 domain-containing protein [Collinsella aerofaciens]|uniref:DUF1788 domain-containing protein n=1 Tax=Collinsella aerofaciens TaxID=74426 RepID=UPI001D035E05|nr:DUF1788 domain-containing protein [Collinsella aerofaciens]MCB5365401.1 DUF1788 domain-containing protein [Collinsella aerofaciens]